LALKVQTGEMEKRETALGMKGPGVVVLEAGNLEG
jgi:hypothetical protein